MEILCFRTETVLQNKSSEIEAALSSSSFNRNVSGSLTEMIDVFTGLKKKQKKTTEEEERTAEEEEELEKQKVRGQVQL